MSVKVEKISEPLLLGEGPHWDGRDLYFVGIQEKTIHRYRPDTGEHSKSVVGDKVGFIVPVEGTHDQFVLGLGRKFVVVHWDGTEGAPVAVLRELGEVDKEIPTNRINDGKADPRGRLFAGTMGREDPAGQFDRNKGSLYRLDGAKITKLVEGVSISNGLAWDVSQKAFYYIDSLERNIRRYDYDIDTGDISNMRHIFDFSSNGVEGLPDGMTIDTDGNLWVAVFGGSCVLHVDPKQGKLLRKLSIPAEQVTSVTFGGPNLDSLMVTTASIPIASEQKPPSGCTFVVTGAGARGLPNVNFKL
ncbi:hypothetical protein ACJJTC_005559 [Scirpophaga incertulas]